MPKSKEFLDSSSDSEQDVPQKKKAKKESSKKTSSKPESDSEDGLISDVPQKKKAKKESSKKPSSKPESDSEDGLISLGSNKFVSVSEFKGKLYVNIREYYEKDGKMLPGRKGIALNHEQWSKLVDSVDELDSKM